MKLLIAPQEFKGTLTAVEAAEAIAEGIRRVRPDAELDVLPLADGGPGTVATVLASAGGALHTSRVHDARVRPIDASWAVLEDGSALIEMSAAAGLLTIPPELRDPTRTTTFGVGELIRAALDAGCRTIRIGAGGSATQDGGTGAARALGVRFLGPGGRPLEEGGAALLDLERIDLVGIDPRLAQSRTPGASPLRGPERLARHGNDPGPAPCRIEVLADVQTPLLGPAGTSRIFAPQKGASPEDVERLERALERLDSVVRAQLGKSLADAPGTGAAGGLAFGLCAFFGATIVPGFDAIASQVRLDERIAAADLVITGEGCLDAQTGLGKGPLALARRARADGKRCVAFAGRVRHAPFEVFDEIVEVSPEVAERDPRAHGLLLRAAMKWMSAQPLRDR